MQHLVSVMKLHKGLPFKDLSKNVVVNFFFHYFSVKNWTYKVIESQGHENQLVLLLRKIFVIKNCIEMVCSRVYKKPIVFEIWRREVLGIKMYSFPTIFGVEWRACFFLHAISYNYNPCHKIIPIFFTFTCTRLSSVLSTFFSS